MDRNLTDDKSQQCECKLVKLMRANELVILQDHIFEKQLLHAMK